MAKTWSADNPKAALMDQKRALIVAAAMDTFLDAGYAEASVNHIAAAAGVSIKTLYRHFDSKDDLFSAVMHAACGYLGRPGEKPAQRPKCKPAPKHDPASVQRINELSCRSASGPHAE